VTTVDVVIPVSEPEIVKPQGSPGGIEGCATTLYSVASRYEEFGELTGSAIIVPGWTGPAHQAYGKAAKRASGEHTRLASALRQVAHACSGHADTLVDLLREYERLVDVKRALDGRRAELVSDVSAAVDVEQPVIDALQDRASALSSEYRTLLLDHDALQKKVRDNEELMRSAFRRADTLDEILSPDGTADPLAASAMGKPGSPLLPGGSAKDRENWWSSLTAAEKEAVTAAYPSIIGSTDGLPADARDQANHISLADDLARLGQKEHDGRLSFEERKALDNARAADKAIAKGNDYVDPITGEKPGTQLWLYDPSAFDGDGKIAIAVGDVDTADDVAVRVPGIKTDASGAPDLMEDAVNVYQSSRYQGDGSSVASMMWLGYDAPDSVGDSATRTEGRAEDGGGRFADAIDGLRASRPYDAAHLTAIGHSYGSTTLAHAATDHGIDVDDIVLVGSPGAGGGVDHASDLGVGADHVYVGRNSRDIVGALGDHGWFGGHNFFGAGLGNDPSEDDFGANRFEAEDPTRSSWHRGIEQHQRYFDPDSESLYNMGRVVDGSGPVNPADHTSDPFIGGPTDPEINREPTFDEPGRSDTERSEN
jgi:hypothetical protein